MTDHAAGRDPRLPRFTALDAVGPYEVLQRIPRIDVTFVGHERGEVRTENGMLGITRRRHLRGVARAGRHRLPRRRRHPPLEHDERVLDWVRHAHADHPVHHIGLHRLAGARRGRPADGPAPPRPTGPATTSSRRTAPMPTAERVVEHLDRRIITAAGVSSGIDMALRLVELLVDRTAAQAAQLMIEYDPQPPFDCGLAWPRRTTLSSRGWSSTPASVRSADRRRARSRTQRRSGPALAGYRSRPKPG